MYLKRKLIYMLKLVYESLLKQTDDSIGREFKLQARQRILSNENVEKYQWNYSIFREIVECKDFGLYGITFNGARWQFR